jgi:hypothetical protein
MSAQMAARADRDRVGQRLATAETEIARLRRTLTAVLRVVGDGIDDTTDIDADPTSASS